MPCLLADWPVAYRKRLRKNACNCTCCHRLFLLLFRERLNCNERQTALIKSAAVYPAEAPNVNIASPHCQGDDMINEKFSHAILSMKATLEQGHFSPEPSLLLIFCFISNTIIWPGWKKEMGWMLVKGRMATEKRINNRKGPQTPSCRAYSGILSLFY